jgi:nitrite reductase (NADH) small subunit
VSASNLGTHQLGPLDHIPKGEGRAYAVDGAQIAVFHLRDGSLRATQAWCPHAGGPLADGQTDLSTLVCPLHLRVFSLSDGTCAEGEPITLYPVTVKDDEIVVDIS